MKVTLMLMLILITGVLKGQEPFTKYPAISYKEYGDWIRDDTSEGRREVYFTKTIPNFFENKDSLKIQITFTYDNIDTSYIDIYRNNKHIQNFFEPFGIPAPTGDLPIQVADINGDGLPDVKFMIPYMSCGLGVNCRVIYLFQKPDCNFTKISYLDMFGEYEPERDFDGDKNYEIITRFLVSYKNHSYWLYNLYNYTENGLINVNKKGNYPIMIQFLNRDNYKITNKITRKKMKDFALPLPEDYDKR
jgi:hypothetical protein